MFLHDQGCIDTCLVVNSRWYTSVSSVGGGRVGGEMWYGGGG